MKRRNKKNSKKGNAKVLRRESGQAYHESLRNLKAIDKPRKRVSSFIAQFDSGECPKCFTKISKGERVRYNADDELIHVLHAHPEIVYDICQMCFLARPCEHDEV